MNAPSRDHADESENSDDIWSPPIDAPLSMSGQPVYKGPPPRRIATWHRGQAWLAATVLGPPGLVALAIWSGDKHKELQGLAYLVLFFWVIAAVVLGHHNSCPRCKHWGTRKTMSSHYSHSASHLTVVKDIGGNHVVDRQRRIYRGGLRCTRCGLRWNGFV